MGMYKRMLVTIVQHNIKWASPVANHATVEKLISLSPHSDLYVLPEMWSTGFATDPADVSERDGLSLAWMQRMAHEYDAAIAGSVSVCLEGRYYNRFYFVQPDGSYCCYDKHHLFSYGGEDKTYTPGSERVVVEWRGVRFLLQVCYDLRFPVFSRNTADEPYDCILYVASWPQSRRRVWDILLQARAIENQCYVIGVNRVGEDPLCHYDGGSVIIDAYGRRVATCDDDAETTATATLDIPSLRAFRKKFPVLLDADKTHL